MVETPPGGVDAIAPTFAGFWTAVATERIDGDNLIVDWKAIKTVGKEVTFAAFEETQTEAATGSVVIDLAKGTVKAKDVNEKADLPKTIDAVKSQKEMKELTVDKTIFRIDQKADAPLRFKFQRADGHRSGQQGKAAGSSRSTACWCRDGEMRTAQNSSQPPAKNLNFSPHFKQHRDREHPLGDGGPCEDR